MISLLLVLRLVHIISGVYWAGTLMFFVTFLEPSLRALGPDGGKVMMELAKRRYLVILPSIAALTILSGLWLMWIVSDGFQPAWMGSRFGIVLSSGALAAVLAFAIGVFVMRPAAMRTMKLAANMAQVSDDATRIARMAEMQSLRERSVVAARTVAGLLALVVAAMAVARYI
jgi:hypothetical protein